LSQSRRRGWSARVDRTNAETYEVIMMWKRERWRAAAAAAVVATASALAASPGSGLPALGRLDGGGSQHIRRHHRAGRGIGL
jgi:hypothetical protein